MKKPAPTLADAVMRESLRPRGYVDKKLGELVAQSRKFVLDKDASRFLSDLAHASYVIDPEIYPDYEAGAAATVAKIDQTRQLARLPHAVTWMEYDAREFRDRTITAYKNVHHIIAKRDLAGKVFGEVAPPASGDEIVPTIGWLMVENAETSFTVYTFVGDGPGAVVLPFSFHWTTDDSVPPFASAVSPGGAVDSHLATGMGGYNVPQVVIGKTPGRNVTGNGAALLAEFTGELRFAWALLAAINDIPIGVKHVRPSKGYVARGRYRTYFVHSIISILLPKGRDPRVVAQRVVEVSRRRAHQVRGHWRRDWRHEGNRIWVREHERGDASLGTVIHDYKVKHEEDVT